VCGGFYGMIQIWSKKRSVNSLRFLHFFRSFDLGELATFGKRL